MMQPALPIHTLTFMVDVPNDCLGDMLQLSTRLRGMIGFQLKHQSCFLDAETSECAGCSFRSQCHYGSSFETVGAVHVPGMGNFGSMLHAWSLRVDTLGLVVRCELVLAGAECMNDASWWQAIHAMPWSIVPMLTIAPSAYLNENLCWAALTPVRLRIKGKDPKQPEVAEAIAASVARKCRALAALHGVDAPQSRLPEPVCSNFSWLDATRYSFRNRETQPMGGWMMHVHWPKDTPVEWLPWLILARELGIGRQTSFGCGRFVPIAL